MRSDAASTARCWTRSRRDTPWCVRLWRPPHRDARLLAGLMCIVAGAVSAHEVRPGYLEIRAVEQGYEVLWKAPMRDGMVLPIAPVLPDQCRDLRAPSRQSVAASLIERRHIDCGEAGLEGGVIRIEGLATTLTDVVVRIDTPEHVETLMLKPDRPQFVVAEVAPSTRIAWDYFVLGVEHILLGIDHLLFVFGLLLIVSGPWQAIKTITAFTLAHSMTLAAATLGWVAVPQGPVEAVIALSIVFLALEVLRIRAGHPSLAAAKPWLVAFTFGLLHGFGFAGALAEVGLPRADIPLALLFFNLGVEAGQLAFIAVLLAMRAIWQLLRMGDLARFAPAAAYGVGCLASYWVIDRTLTLF
ncbi:MAG: HupE/UreJ family protein [Gammaproteobacteria bacterium]|nr:HupE/UreJ family protein [Gammaproteobacteria bacterium]